MIRYFTERKLRAIFAAVSQGDFWPMVDALGSRFTYRFEGDSPIGGVRTSRESMQLWWERMYRLFPGFSIEERDVAVAGWAWDLRIHMAPPITDMQWPLAGPFMGGNPVPAF